MARALGSTFIAPHNCASAFQDAQYGPRARVFNVGKSNSGQVGHCTVCCPAGKPDPTGRARRTTCSGCTTAPAGES